MDTHQTVALITALAEHPVAHLMLVDSLMDNAGLTREQADERLTYELVRAIVAGTTRRAARIRTAIRAQCGWGANTHCTVHVIPGSSAPVLTGQSWYYTTPGGRPVYYPSAYRRAGGEPVYHPSSYTVTVGAGWVQQGIL